MKLFRLIIACWSVFSMATAQNVANYQFTASGGTYTSLTGSTSPNFTGGNSDDGWFNSIPIGFTFYYMGTGFTTVSVCTKGWMAFGQDISNVYATNNLSTNGHRPLVAPLWDDHDIQSAGNFSYLTTGTAPARVFTAQWSAVKWRYTATAGNISFQVKLYETTGKVEFIYHPEAGALSTSPTASIGIAATATGSGNFQALNNASASPTSSTTADPANISVRPADGQVYTFTPPSVTPAPPAAITFMDITKTSMTVGWTDNSTTETFFTVWVSQDGTNFTQVNAQTSTNQAGTGTVYSYSHTGLLPGLTYHYRIMAGVEGNAPSEYLSGSQSTIVPTVIVSAASGNWSSAATWSSGTVPGTLDNVTIADGHTVLIDVTDTCNQLNVGQGVSGILRYHNSATAVTLNIIQGVTVSAGGIFDAGATGGVNASHFLRIGGTTAISMGTGNLTVNGSFDMYIGSSNGKCTVTFFGIPDATISGSGAVTDFYRVVLNKGAVAAKPTQTPPVLELQRAWTTNGGTTAGFLYTHTSGTIRVGGTFTASLPVYASAGYDIPVLGGCWLSNPNFTMTGQAGSPTNNGMMKLSAGTWNIGTTSSHTLGAGTGAFFLIENGTMNLSSKFNTANAVSWIQSGGTVNVTTAGNTSSNVPGFGLTNTASSFTMSGGTISQVMANTGTIKIDFYNNSSVNNITGGLLQLGNGSSGAAKTFHIRGTAPEVVLTSTSGNHNCNLAGALTIMGDLETSGTGFFSTNGQSLTVAGMNAGNPGNIFIGTGGVLTLNTLATVALAFTGSYGNQALTNNGTITAGQTAGLRISNTYPGGTVTLPVGLVMMGDATLELAAGNLVTGTGITLGTGGTSGFTYIQGDGTSTGTITRNYGSGIVNYTYNGNTPRTTGSELPAVISGTLAIGNPAGVTLATSLQAGKLNLSAGVLITTTANLLTITGTATGDVIYTGGMVQGPLQRTLPAALAAGTTWLFPLGKSSYRPLELVDPLTTAGTVVIRAEVFDGATGGIAGPTMFSLDGIRYWQTEITSGSGNFTGTSVRVTETGLNPNSGLAKSNSLAGTYDLVSVGPPSGNTLTSSSIPGAGYYTIGDKRMNYVSSTTTQANTAYLREGSVNQEIIGLQIVTNGSLDPALLTSITFSTAGSTLPADIASAKVYYTGTSSVFSTSTPFGSAFLTPTGSFNITGSQALAEGTNYLWLAFDISVGVTDNNVVDAECLSVTVRGMSATPSVTAPTGNRTVRAALTGIVTVGTGGSYPTLTGAGGLFEKVALVGLKGNLTAHIVSDITEPAVNQLTNWYEAGGSGYTFSIVPNASVLRTLSGTYTGGLVRLGNVSRVTIDGRFAGAGKFLAFNNLSTTGSIAALQFIGLAAGQGCTDIMVRNCHFSTGNITTTSCGISLGGATPGSTGFDHDGVTIRDCRITQAYYGIYAGGRSTGQNDNLVIAGDSVGSLVTGQEISRNGIYLLDCPGVEVSGNTVFNIVNTSTQATGIHSGSGCINAMITGNKVSGVHCNTTATSQASGIVISPGFTTVNVSVINNIVTEITAGGSNNLASSGIAGIRLDNGTGFNVWFNSVNLFGSVSHTTTLDNSTAIYINAQGGVDLRNNILRNSIENTTGSAYAYAIYSDMAKTGFSSIDFNDYFGTGPEGRLGYITYSAATTLSSWIVYTSQDLNSIAEDPLYAGDTDLHLDFTSPALGAGTPIPGITTDFENVTRNNTTPAMGALETPRDGVGPVIAYTPLIKTTSMAARTLTATITDVTGVPTAGSGLPVLYWNINRGSWIPAPAIYSGNDQYQFTFGSGVSSGDTVFYYIAAQDTWPSPNVSTMPQGGSSGYSINPPACSTPPSAPDFYRIATLLSGPCTVGSGGTYPTLTGDGGLFQAVNSNVLTGTIVATVISNLVEPGTHGLLQWTEEGTGMYTINLRPGDATERLIQGDVATAMIRIDGADRFIIDGISGGSGRYLRFRNTNTSAAATIHFLNGAGNDTIRNCIIEGASTVSTSGTILIGTSSATSGNRYIHIAGNQVRDRSDATGVPAAGIRSAGTASRLNHSVSILGNEIFNFLNYGVTVVNTGNGNSWDISNNSIYCSLATPPASLQKGISLAPGALSGNHTVNGNFVGGQAPLCGGSSWINTGTSVFHGIYLDVSTYDYFSTVSGNTITNISLTNVNPNELVGIYLAAGTADILGNTIGDPDPVRSLRSNSQTFSRKLDGIRNYSESYNVEITGNTITNLVLTAASGYPETSGISVTSADIRNNKISGIGNCVNSTLEPYINGILIDGNFGSFNEIANNSIILDGGTSADATLYGIYDKTGYDQNEFGIYHNSISISGPGNYSVNTACFCREYSASATLKNNAFTNFRSSVPGGGLNYAIYLVNPEYCISDYNDLHCPDGFLGYFDYIDYATLPAWNAATLLDAHSISMNPLYVSNTSDLHPGTGSPLAFAGTGLPEVPEDLDGLARNPAEPTIGCYEVSQSYNKTWNGSISIHWGVAGNWTPSGVPTATDDLFIPSGTPFPCQVTTTSGSVSGYLTIGAGAVLQVNMNCSLTCNETLTISQDGTLTNYGTLQLKKHLVNQNTED